MNASWPPPDIVVGTRVHWGVSSPDTGVVLKITKNGRRARVRWDRNGERWEPMDKLFSVTRSLTEWHVYKQGKRPCRRCGYRHEPHTRGGICRLCQGVN